MLLSKLQHFKKYATENLLLFIYGVDRDDNNTDSGEQKWNDIRNNFSLQVDDIERKTYIEISPVINKLSKFGLKLADDFDRLAYDYYCFGQEVVNEINNEQASVSIQHRLSILNDAYEAERRFMIPLDHSHPSSEHFQTFRSCIGFTIDLEGANKIRHMTISYLDTLVINQSDLVSVAIYEAMSCIESSLAVALHDRNICSSLLMYVVSTSEISDYHNVQVIHYNPEMIREILSNISLCTLYHGLSGIARDKQYLSIFIWAWCLSVATSRQEAFLEFRRDNLDIYNIFIAVDNQIKFYSDLPRPKSMDLQAWTAFMAEADQKHIPIHVFGISVSNGSMNRQNLMPAYNRQVTRMMLLARVTALAAQNEAIRHSFDTRAAAILEDKWLLKLGEYYDAYPERTPSADRCNLSEPGVQHNLCQVHCNDFVSWSWVCIQELQYELDFLIPRTSSSDGIYVSTRRMTTFFMASAFFAVALPISLIVWQLLTRSTLPFDATSLGSWLLVLLAAAFAGIKECYYRDWPWYDVIRSQKLVEETGKAVDYGLSNTVECVCQLFTAFDRNVAVERLGIENTGALTSRARGKTRLTNGPNAMQLWLANRIIYQRVGAQFGYISDIPVTHEFIGSSKELLWTEWHKWVMESGHMRITERGVTPIGPLVQMYGFAQFDGDSQ